MAQVREELAKAESWLYDSLAQQAELAPNVDPVLTLAGMREKMEAFTQVRGRGVNPSSEGQSLRSLMRWGGPLSCVGAAGSQHLQPPQAQASPRARARRSPQARQAGGGGGRRRGASRGQRDGKGFGDTNPEVCLAGPC
jgi:hypothetical protein